jgi:hypothetical protein
VLAPLAVPDAAVEAAVEALETVEAAPDAALAAEPTLATEPAVAAAPAIAASGNATQPEQQAAAVMRTRPNFMCASPCVDLPLQGLSGSGTQNRHPGTRPA